jgi:tRNA pseudouridine55 synthase
MAQNNRRPPARELDGILLLDKASGLTSNAALQRIKWLYRAAKAGHTGSLDPLATGLLPICLGEATKLSGYLLDADKTYVATARLGTATTTGDAEGQAVRHSDPSAVSRDMIEACIPRLLGSQHQIPPMYSAIKRDGVKLYELARAGVEIERAPREIEILGLRLLDFCAVEAKDDAAAEDAAAEAAPAQFWNFSFEVRCSKGTYVRTLAEDWAAMFGQAAHLIALRRTGLGALSLARAHTLEDSEGLKADTAALDQLLSPTVDAVATWPRFVADAAQCLEFLRGQVLGPFEDLAPGRLAVVDPALRLRGLAEVDALGYIAPKRWLADPDRLLSPRLTSGGSGPRKPKLETKK